MNVELLSLCTVNEHFIIIPYRTKSEGIEVSVALPFVGSLRDGAEVVSQVLAAANADVGSISTSVREQVEKAQALLGIDRNLIERSIREPVCSIRFHKDGRISFNGDIAVRGQYFEEELGAGQPRSEIFGCVSRAVEYASK